MQQPLRLKTVVQRDLKQSISGDPVQAALQFAEKIMNQGANQFSASGPSLGVAPRTEVRVSRASMRKEQTDELGFQHIRVAQKYKGLPVVGAELIVHINDRGLVYMINGSYQPDTGINIEPTVVADDALQIGLDEQQGKENMRVTSDPSLVIYGSHLAWYYVIEYTGTEPGQWRYYVDAHKGRLINRYNNIQNAAPVVAHGAAATVSGNRLAGEDGTSVSMQGFDESAGSSNYFLYSFANLWGIYNYDHGVNSPGAGADWIQQATSNWGGGDPAAVSCAKNFEDTQNYVSTVLVRNSFDNSGGFAQASVHVDTNYVNAYWDGSSFYFGDGDGSTANALTILDVAAHEYGHAT